MASILRSAQEMIMPQKEKESEPATTSAPSTSGSATGGLLNLIKKTTGIGASETEGPISPPESEATSPALAPSDKRSTPAPISTNTSTLKPLSPPLSHPSSPTSPIRSISPPSPTAASRQFALGGSPARVSASSTQIFERNVQEAHPITSSTGSNGVPVTATKIPAHIATENHIPAVLEASSIAITDGSIDPDSVEIAVMTSHQSLSSQASNSLHPHKDTHADDSSSGTTAVHPPSTSHSQHSSNAFQDKRRLSFISFSDIVQAEQADLLDSTILSPNPSTNVNPGFPAATVIDQVGISGITETLLVRRSPSPRYGASSPPRTSAGLLPGVGKSEQEGLVVETLGQSIRKTGSGDLGKGF